MSDLEKVFTIIGGLTLGILGVIVFLGLTILGYFWIDKRRNNKGKKDAAVITLIIVFVASFLFRFITAMAIANQAGLLTPDNIFIKTIFQCVFALYSTGGAFTLEGQEGSFFASIDNIEALKLIYFGSLLWMAASFFIIISLRVSYSFTSKLRLWFRRKLLVFPCYKRKTDIYIFTNASEDSLRLAQSVEEHHLNLKKEDKRYYFIIFASDELEEFDKNNELHQQIRMSGYYYCRLYKPKEKTEEDQLLCELVLSHRCTLFKNLSELNVKIFAFNNNVEEKGNESKNSDVVIDDIDRLLGDVFNKKKEMNAKQRELLSSIRPPYVDYYVLSNNNANYEFYGKTIIEQIQKHLDKDKFEKDDYNLLTQMFQIHVVNEALMAGEDLITCRQQNVSDYLSEIKDGENTKYVINHTDTNKANVLIIGFGQTGQRALDNLYEDFAAIVKDKSGLFVPAKFEAVACDPRMKNIAGSYIQQRPSFLFKDPDGDGFINEDKLKQRYEPHFKGKFNDIKKYLEFPVIHLLEKNYNDPSFAKDVNKIISVQSTPSYDFANFDVIVVCLGDDEANINLANSMLGNLRHHLYREGGIKSKIKQRIFVNIRDERNVERLNWNNSIELAKNVNVYVYPFGNRTSLYSYDKIIEEGPYRFVNALYSFMRAKSETTVAQIKNFDCNTCPITKKEYPEAKRIKLFLALNPMYKESNEHSSRFANYVRDYIEANKENVDWDYLGNLEHIRWCRFHIASGYVFSKTIFDNISDKRELSTKDDPKYGHYYEKGYTTFGKIEEYAKCVLKLHNCIIPYGIPDDLDMLPNIKRRYDYFNTKYAKFVASNQKK